MKPGPRAVVQLQRQARSRLSQSPVPRPKTKQNKTKIPATKTFCLNFLCQWRAFRGLVKGRDLIRPLQSILRAAREKIVETKAEGITRTTAKAMVRGPSNLLGGIEGYVEIIVSVR